MASMYVYYLPCTVWREGIRVRERERKVLHSVSKYVKRLFHSARKPNKTDWCINCEQWSPLHWGCHSIPHNTDREAGKCCLRFKHRARLYIDRSRDHGDNKEQIATRTTRHDHWLVNKAKYESVTRQWSKNNSQTTTTKPNVGAQQASRWPGSVDQLSLPVAQKAFSCWCLIQISCVIRSIESICVEIDRFFIHSVTCHVHASGEAGAIVGARLLVCTQSGQSGIVRHFHEAFSAKRKSKTYSLRYMPNEMIFFFASHLSCFAHHPPFVFVPIIVHELHSIDQTAVVETQKCGQHFMCVYTCAHIRVLGNETKTRSAIDTMAVP